MIPPTSARLTTLPRRLCEVLGIDRPIAYAVTGRFLSVLTAPVTFFLIVSRLSSAEQGYYYTFGSLLGVTVFFELGLNNVITQFASHEKAGLQWTDNGSLTGDESSFNRLGDLLRKAVYWYGVVAILIIACVLPIGFLFFAGKTGYAVDVSWSGPWIWLVIASGLWCWASPVFAIFSGCGLVAEMQLNALVQQVGYASLLWLVLILHGGLYATPVAATFAACYAVIWAFTKKRPLIRALWSADRDRQSVSWPNEIWPMQWRIALSWISGYLMTQLFNPILFHYHGAEVAGKMGLTLSLCAALNATSLAWITTKSPIFGTLVAQRKFEDLDRTFFRSLIQSGLIITLAAGLLWLFIVWLASMDHPYSRRLLSPGLCALLFVNAVALHLTNAQAIYLRAHKREPLLPVYLASAVAMLISNYFLGRYVGAGGMVAGYVAVTMIIGLGFGTFVFLSKRTEWHV